MHQAPKGRPSCLEEAPDCELAQAWVQENIGNLPKSYEEFSDLPHIYRKHVYAELPHTERVSLWSAHIERIITTEELSLEQANLLSNEILPELPDLLKAEKAEIEKLEARAQEVLDYELTSKAFVELGGEPAHSAPAAAGGVECSCSQQSDWCSDGYACASYSCDTSSGCGTFWVYDCDGACQTPHPTE